MIVPSLERTGRVVNVGVSLANAEMVSGGRVQWVCKLHQIGIMGMRILACCMLQGLANSKWIAE